MPGEIVMMATHGVPSTAIMLWSVTASVARVLVRLRPVGAGAESLATHLDTPHRPPPQRWQHLVFVLRLDIQSVSKIVSGVMTRRLCVPRCSEANTRYCSQCIRFGNDSEGRDWLSHPKYVPLNGNMREWSSNRRRHCETRR
jgi:hypothetical protein